MRTLLILGGLEEFVPLVRLAKKNGIRTVVVDGNPGAPAKTESIAAGGAAYDADVRDIAAIALIAKNENAEAITTAYSDLLLECMVKIADASGLPCHLKPSQLPYYRDKAVTNRTLEELSIGTPKSAALSEGFSDSDLEGLAFPMVVKPIDLYGSRGLSIVESADEIRERFAAAAAGSSQKRILAEEYAAGREFNLQAWVRHGKVRILGIADREKTSHDPKEIPLSTRNVYPSKAIESVYAPAKEALEKYVSKTLQKEGPLCMQFFAGNDGGILVGEIAARFLGYEHELLEYADGISVEELLLASAFDDEKVDGLLDACNPFGNCTAAVLYFHGRDGIIADQSAARAAFDRPEVIYSKLFYEDGERIGSPQRMPYVARCYIKAEARDGADALTQEIFDAVSIKDAEGRELLYPNCIG